MQNTVRLTTVGTLVSVNGQPVIAAPTANPVTKNGKKQFWFYHKNRAILATQTATGYTAKY